MRRIAQKIHREVEQTIEKKPIEPEADYTAVGAATLIAKKNTFNARNRQSSLPNIKVPSSNELEVYDLLKQQNENYQDALDKMNDINKLLRYQKELESTKNIDLNVYKPSNTFDRRNT